MIYDKSHQSDSSYVSVNTLINPKPKQYSGISALTPYNVEEQEEPIPSAGSPIATMPTQDTFSNHAISKPDDLVEFEADRVSEEITNPNNIGLRSGQKEQPAVRKKALNGKELNLNPTRQMNNLSGGNPLSNDERDFFEPRFGSDFHNVKVHTDSKANETADAINARAYTTGNNIVFAKGEYQPGTNEGKKLLAHELTHVVQQRESGSFNVNTIQRQANRNEYTITSTQGNVIKVGTAVTYNFNGNIPEGADFTWVIENDPNTYAAFLKDNPGLLQRYTGNTNKREMKAIARIPGTHTIRVDITKGGQCLSSTGYKQVVVSELTSEHLQIMEQAGKISVNSNVKEWTTMDLVKWKTSKDDKTLFDFKKQWVKGYNDVIKAAAKENDLPEYLVAGVAYIEVGGDPLWIDDIAYNIRKNIPTGKKADRTSFGNISMQIGTAAETLRYSPDKITEVQREAIISSLKDPRQNIFMAAKHLSDLRNIDFKGVEAKQLTEDQVKVIGTRFNRGGGLSLQSIMKNLSYGEFIIKRKSLIEELLND
jgi:hypothetical protein